MLISLARDLFKHNARSTARRRRLNGKQQQSLSFAAESLEVRALLTVFTPGSINGQDGWSGGVIPISSTVDQEVVNNASDAHAGVGAWRVSNSTVNGGQNGAFNGFPFSPALAVSAGQPSSGAAADRFSGTYYFKSASATADGSNVEIDLGTSNGNDRNTFMAITNRADGDDGLQLRMAEPDITNPGNDYFFGTRVVSTNISRTDWHRIDITANFNNGASNDTFTIALDGVVIGNTTLGSPNYGSNDWGTFEGYRDAKGQPYQQSNRLFFRSGAAPSDYGSFSNTAAQGVLIDDVSYQAWNSSNPSNILASYSAKFEPTNSVASAYVDDSWSGTALGADPDGAGPAVAYGYDAFATIQAGINAVDVGGTVTVFAGTYQEHVNVNKDITLLGANSGVNPVVSSRSAESIVDGQNNGASFAVSADGATIDGFEVINGQGGLNAGINMDASTSNISILNNVITANTIGIYANSNGASLIQHNLFDGNNVAGPSGGAGIYSEASVDLTIDGNEFKNHTVNNPVLFAATAVNAHQNLTFTNNSLHDNNYGFFALAVDGGLIQGNVISTTDPGGATAVTIADGSSGVQILNNVLSGNARALKVTDYGYGFGPTSNIVAHENDLSNSSDSALTVTASGSTGIVDASANYWGSSDPVAVVSMIAAPDSNVDFSPVLDDGDAEIGTIGFQADLSSVTAHTLGAQSDTTGRIQEGIDVVAAGGTVNVAPGDYTERAVDRTLIQGGTYQFGIFVSAAKSGTTIQGVDGAGNVITDSTATQANITTEATNNFGYSGTFIEGDHVTLQGLNFGHNILPSGKTLEIVGDGLTFRDNEVSDPEGTLYFNDSLFNTGTNTSHIQSYTIDGNLFDLGVSIDITSGAGFSGDVSDRTITGNHFVGGTNAHDGVNWSMITFNGSNTGVAWFVQSVGGAVITGNTFDASDMYIRARGTYDNSQFDWKSYFEENTFPTSVVDLADADTFDLQTSSYTSGSYTFNDVRRIGGIIQAELNNAVAGNTVLAGAGSYTENLTISKQVTLEGAGSGNTATDTVIHSAAGSTPVITISGTGTDDLNRLAVSNLRVTGATGDLNFGSGILVQSATPAAHLTLSNIDAVGNQGTGVAFNNTASVSDVVISGSSLSNNGTGLRIATAVPSFTGLYVLNSQIDDNQSSGFTYNPSGTLSNVGTNFNFKDVTLNNNSTAGVTNQHDMSFAGFHGNATLTNVTVTSGHAGVANSSSHGILFTNSSVYAAAGHITLNGVTVNGAVGKSALSFQLYNDVSNISLTNVDVKDAIAPWSQITVDQTSVNPLDLGNTKLKSLAIWASGGVDATSASFYNAVGGALLDTAVLANDFQIENQVDHKVDNNAHGLVRWVAGNIYVSSSNTINNGIAAAQSGDTVNVQAGNYNEDVAVNKTVQLIGAGAASTTISGPLSGGGSTVAISASNVEVSGFKITRDGDNVAQWNDANLNSAGISVNGQANTGLVVHDNLITGNRSGIDINNVNGETIRNNVITNNHTGLIFRNQTDNTTVVENEITSNFTVGVLFLDASGGTNSPIQTAANSHFNNNNISGNWYAQIVDRQTGGALPAPGLNVKNFENNWFGTAAPVITTANSSEPAYGTHIPAVFGGTDTKPTGKPDIAGPASANFDIYPILTSGTDTNVETTPGRGTYGFQGNLGNVTFNGTASDDNFILDYLDNGDVNVTLNGVFQGTLTTPTSIALNGGGGTDSVVVNGTSHADTFALAKPIAVGVAAPHINNTTVTMNSVEVRTLNGQEGNDSFTFAGATGAWTITGGEDDDSFAFTKDGAVNGTVSGTVNGGNGIDLLDYSAYSTIVTVDLGLGTATGTAGVNGMNNITGGLVADKLTGNDLDNVLIGGPGSDKLNGGLGNDTIINSNDANYTLSNTSLKEAGAVTATDTLTGIEIAYLTGGAGDNTFTLTGWTGEAFLNGNGGTDTVAQTRDANYTLSDGLITAVDSTTLSDSHSIHLASIETANLIGGASANTFTINGWTGNATLNAGVSGVGTFDKFVADPNQANTFNITALGAGTLVGASTVNFLGIESLTGGALNDTFNFNAGAKVNGKIDGGSGDNTLDFHNYISTTTTNLQLGTSTVAVAGFSNIGEIRGGTTSSTVYDTLIGADVASTWSLTASGTGAVGGIAFSGMDKLTGGSDADQFVLADSSVLFTAIAGGLGSDTLKAPAGITNLFTVTANDTGKLNGANAFTSIENLVGGDEDDLFTFSTGKTVTGSVDGGAGRNTLNYSAFAPTAPVIVDLSTGSATVATFTLQVSNIVDVYGGNGADTLTGDSQDNLLVGNSGNDTIHGGLGNDVILGGAGNDLLYGEDGRDLLVGGTGAEPIEDGGEGDDILIGGKLDVALYNESTKIININAIDAIMEEWTSGNSYADRVANLQVGVGATPAVNALRTTHPASANPATVLDDAAADTLTGGADQDWFFKRLAVGGIDTLADLEGGESVTSI